MFNFRGVLIDLPQLDFARRWWRDRFSSLGPISYPKERYGVAWRETWILFTPKEVELWEPTYSW